MTTVQCPECGKQLIVADPSRQFMFCEYCGTKINLNVNVNLNLNYSKSEHTERIVDEAKIKNADNVNRVIGVFATPFEEMHKAKERARLEEEEEDRQEAEEARRAAEAKRERKEKIMRGEYSFKEMVVDFVQSKGGKAILAIIAYFILVFVVFGYLDRNEKDRAHQAKLEALEHEKAAASRLAMGQASIPDFSSSDDARTFVKKLKSSGFVNVTSEAVPDLIAGISSKEYEIVEVLVDGAPDYEPDAWYPTDTDIVVRYHTYRDGAKEARDELINRATDAAKDKANEMIDGVSDKINSFLS